MRKSYKWLTTQAKSIEKKKFKKYGRSLSFTGIERILNRAIIELETDTQTLIIDDEKYNKIKKQLLKKSQKDVKK